MDVHCFNCGEPWDQHHLRHDLPEDPDETESEGWKFGSGRLVVLRCPCCPKDGTGLPNLRERAEIVQEIALMLGDDEDGLASALNDFDL